RSDRGDLLAHVGVLGYVNACLYGRMSQLLMRVLGQEDVEQRLPRLLHAVALEVAKVERRGGRRALCDPARRDYLVCDRRVHPLADARERIEAGRVVREVEHREVATLAVDGIPGLQRIHEEPARQALDQVAMVEDGE